MGNREITFIENYFKGKRDLVHMGMSGGSTKISGIYGAAKAAIENNYHPHIFSGISAGGILALPLAMKKFREVEDIIMNFNLDTIFDKKPVNKKGVPTVAAIFRIASGKTYLGSMGNLRKAIKNIVPENEFYAFTADTESPLIFIGTVNFKDGSRYHHLVNTGTYEEYLNIVIASSSIPVFTPALHIGDDFFYDGGVRDHCPTAWVLSTIPGIKKNLSIYSRPKDYKLSNLKWEAKNVLNVLQRTIDIMNIEISKNDEEKENFLAKELSLGFHKQIFLPSIMESLYDTNKRSIIKLYEAGVMAGEDIFLQKLG